MGYVFSAMILSAVMAVVGYASTGSLLKAFIAYVLTSSGVLVLALIAAFK